MFVLRTMFVLRRTEDGKFVAPSGSKSSYVRSLQAARVFQTREAAETERCIENETIVSITSLLKI